MALARKMKLLVVTSLALLQLVPAQAFVLRDREPGYAALKEKRGDQRSAATQLAAALRDIQHNAKSRSGAHSNARDEERLAREQLMDYLKAQQISEMLQGNALTQGYDGGQDLLGVGGVAADGYYGGYYDDYEGDYAQPDDVVMAPAALMDYDYDADDEDYPSETLPEASEEELADIMGDDSDEVTGNGNEPEEVKEEPAQENAQRELEDIFNDGGQETPKAEEKKEVNWAPQVLGMTGQKRGAGAATGGGQVQAYEQSHGQVRKLSSDEVKNLLSSAKDAEVQSVDKEVSMTNVNGEQVAIAKEIHDILTEDEDGDEAEVVVEHDLPEGEAQALSDDMLAAEAQQMAAVDAQVNDSLEKMAALTREVLAQFPAGSDLEYSAKKKRSDMSLTDESSSSDLAKQCLLRYILLEDEENTDLAQALDWASRAQYEANDQYIPMQVDYLRKAVMREQMLQQLQDECLDLLGIGDLGQLTQADQPALGQLSPADQADSVLANDIDEGRPRKRAEFVPSFADSLDEEDDETEAENEALEELLEEEALQEEAEEEGQDLSMAQGDLDEQGVRETLDDAYTQYLASQLQGYLEEMEQQEDADDADALWYDAQAEQDGGDDLPDKDWMLNPLLRQLVEKYERAGTMARDMGNEIDSEADYDRLLAGVIGGAGDEMCEAVEDLTDNCAYARALGWALDDEAMNLCNRHQLCYACGESHGISADHCDLAYQVEAYRACEGEEDELRCINQADTLYGLMSRIHTPVYSTRLECDAPCVEDFITGDFFKK